MADHVDREEFGDDVAYRVRINFHNLLELARENRILAKAVVAGSVPTEMKEAWKRLQAEGIRTKIIDRSEMGGSLPPKGDAARWHYKHAGDCHTTDGRWSRLGIWKRISVHTEGNEGGGWMIELVQLMQ